MACIFHTNEISVHSIKNNGYWKGEAGERKKGAQQRIQEENFPSSFPCAFFSATAFAMQWRVFFFSYDSRFFCAYFVGSQNLIAPNAQTHIQNYAIVILSHSFYVGAQSCNLRTKDSVLRRSWLILSRCSSLLSNCILKMHLRRTANYCGHTNIQQMRNLGEDDDTDDDDDDDDVGKKS